jgi:hypothetical protein
MVFAATDRASGAFEQAFDHFIRFYSAGVAAAPP